MSLLELSGLHAHYGKSHILHGVDLAVPGYQMFGAYAATEVTNSDFVGASASTPIRSQMVFGLESP